MIQQQKRLLEALAARLRAGADIVRSKEASARLLEMAEFYVLMREAAGGAIDRWKRRRRLR